jgi:translation initiation factor 2B subunit (eIF-2B alpha/beta/delta family)
MVAVAAKEFSVPVVGVTGTYMLTPLFAHNQLAALGQLLSPAGVIGYDALDPEAFDNVEVVVPAFDTLPPDLLALYVTNNGSHQVLCY